MTRDQDPPAPIRDQAAAYDPALYDADFFVWTQRQAAALRALPRHPDAAGIDVAHIAEEIEDMGKRDLREVSSFLARLIEHLLKLAAAPSSRDAAHWWSEAVHFQSAAVDAFTPGMRQLMDNERIWRKGCNGAERFFKDLGNAPETPTASPFTLDALLADAFDVDGALATLAAVRDTPRA